MAELLFLSASSALCYQIEGRAHKEGFRTKVSLDLDTALEWIGRKNFDIAIVDLTLKLPDIFTFCHAITNKESDTLLFGANLGEASPSHAYELKILGGIVISGLPALDECLRRYMSLRSKDAPRTRVLVVEDLDSPRDILCTYLEGLGLTEVKGVASAREALSLLEAQPNHFSCIITDVRMPEIDGCRFIDQVRKHDYLRHLPVVVLTAHGTADCLIECLKAGASGFLVKPPRRADLVREIKRAARIMAGHASPRLTSNEEAEAMREILYKKGFV